jgi:hypothetical protein
MKLKRMENPRIFKVSSKLTAMLNALPKKTERIFGNRFLSGVEGDFSKQRKKVAQKLQNPRLRQITFHTQALEGYYGIP